MQFRKILKLQITSINRELIEMRFITSINNYLNPSYNQGARR